MRNKGWSSFGLLRIAGPRGFIDSKMSAGFPGHTGCMKGCVLWLNPCAIMIFLKSTRTNSRIRSYSRLGALKYPRAKLLMYEPESKLLVSPSITPIMLPYMIPYITPSKEFRIWLIWRWGYLRLSSFGRLKAYLGIGKLPAANLQRGSAHSLMMPLS